MKIKLEVEKIIRKRWAGLKDAKELISLFGIEKQTNAGYNGRQLLELFQNCEDEGATKVRILLDTENCLLEISNDGNKPFSIKGYDSIFYPGLSSKVSSGFIGNKGLGFRSIINWADEISIISNNFKVIFNPKFKKDILINKIGYTENELIEIRTERKLNQDIYPIALLNSCKIVDLDRPHDFTTTISIKYKKERENDIIKQVESISSKTLLFLQNINTIEIDGDIINKIISVSRRRIDNTNTEIKYNGDTYYVLSDEGVVDEDLIEDKESSEPKRYSVKIAYNDDLSFKDKFLYNYFKTQIPFELPFVVHASLELDQNRNHSTESKLNPFILEKLFQLHLKFIEILKNKNDKSWLPYQTINNDNFNTYSPYSDIIDNYWGSFEIYPTLSGKYLNLSVAKNLGNSFAKFMADNSLEQYFEQQIVFYDLDILPNQHVKKPENYVDIIESIAVNLDFIQRSKFIKLLLTHYPHDKFSVLIDEYNKPISVDDYVYTDKTADNKRIEVPTYSNIRFIHPVLHKLLINELDLQSEISKSRMLKEKLEKISDVHSFEPQTVIKKIISETNIYLSENGKKSSDIIREFYKVLYNNFKLRDENQKLDFDSKIPCFNKLNNQVDIKTLILSDEFETGKKSNTIFGKLYEDKYIIANLSLLGLETESLDDVEYFLKWLGINQYVIIEKKNNNFDAQYISKLNSQHNININNYELFHIKHFVSIFPKEKTNINQIIAWLSLDEKLDIIFNNYTTTNSNSEKINYFYRSPKTLSPFINFIFYSIIRQFQIHNYLITSKKEEWFNPFKVDYDYLQEVNKNLDKKEVDRILFFFGAKKDFNDLSISFLRTKLEELAERKNHKGAQVFYKSLVGHYKENKKKIADVPLYAKEGDIITIKNSSQIYFSDRIQLPDYLTNKFPIFYYPSRSGGSTAIEMFGLQNLNDLDLEVIKDEKNSQITDEFNLFIKEIKPFILAFRLDKITSETVRTNQVQRLNKLKINCCNELICSIEGEVFTIEPFNYIYSNDQFYLNVSANVTLKELKKNKQFVDNLSDIFLKTFDTIDEKKIFESIIKQSKEDNIYDTNNELAEGIVEEAKILLGEISIRLSIWKTIFKLKEIEEYYNLNDNNLEGHINYYFPEIENKNLFDADENLEEIRRIRKVFNDLSINLKEYNNVSDYKLTFDKLLQKELNNYYDLQKKNLKNQLWNNLRNKKKEEQITFLKGLHKIETLLQPIALSKNLNEYNYKQIILEELKNVFSPINFEFDNDEFHDYDLIEKQNIEYFSSEDILKIRRDEELNSLSYFENHIEYIKSKITDEEETSIKKDNIDFNLGGNHPAELIKGFEIEISPNPSFVGNADSPWMGNSNELSSNQKKKLGSNVEEIVKKFLDESPELYQKVEYISKTNEGAHYDIKYFDVIDKEIKFIECKYYNGVSFFLSREEKNFAFENLNKYEIWLVNKDSKIFCIKDIESLGDLQPVNYKVYIKLKEHAITN